MADADSVRGSIKFRTDKGEFVVAIDTIKNAIAFERKFNVSATVLAVQPRIEWLAFMAYAAAKDQGLPVGDDFDAFVGTLDGIEAIGDDEDGEAVNPTDGEQ